jgi:hypothetical protein
MGCSLNSTRFSADFIVWLLLSTQSIAIKSNIEYGIVTRF